MVFFIKSFFGVNYCKILLWRVHRQWHSCACFPIWLVADSFQCNPTMKLSYVKDMCVSSWRFVTSLGPWVNVQSHQCGSWVVYRCCEALVTNWKSLRGRGGSFHGFWVRADGRRSSSGKRETRHQLLAGLHRDLQQNHDTVDRVTGGRKGDNIHRWAWCERHSNWHSNPTGVGNRSLQRHDTNLHSVVNGAI